MAGLYMKYGTFTLVIWSSKEQQSSTSFSYLDVLITIDKGKYSNDVYDKRDGFNFTSLTCVATFPLSQLMGCTFPSLYDYVVHTCSSKIGTTT